MLLRIANALHALSPLLLLAPFLLSEGVELLWGGTAGGLILARTVRGNGQQAFKLITQCVLYGALAGIVLTRNQWNPEEKDVVALTVFCCIAWIGLFGSFEEGLDIGFPIGLLTCTVSVLTAGGVADSIPGPWLAGAAVTLVGSGALRFAASMVHPLTTVPAIKVQGAAGGLVAQLIIGLIAVAFVLLGADVSKKASRKVAGRLSTLVGEGGDSRSCELVGDPPDFDGEEVGKVWAVSGELPEYLSEQIFMGYEKGRWYDNKAVNRSAQAYGKKLPGDSGEADSRVGGKVRIKWTKGNQPCFFPVPYGSLRQSLVNLKQLSDDKSRTTEGKPMAFGISWTDHTGFVEKPDISLEELQEDVPRKVQQLADVLNDATISDRARIRRVKTYLRKNMMYDRSSPFPEGEKEKQQDPVEVFLFEEQRGWCVHFASAGVLMLRAMGIPARMVSGYRISSAKGQTAEIKDEMGHSWCEALVKTPRGYKWKIVEPRVRLGTAGSSEGKRAASVILSVAAIMGTVGIILFGFKRQPGGIRRLRKEYRNEDPPASDLERVTRAYNRALSLFGSQHITKPDSVPPRSFAEIYVPEQFRRDFMILVDAYERVNYMGFRRIGRLRQDIELAERRLLGIERR